MDCSLAKSHLSSLKKLQREFDVLVEELKKDLSDRPTINRVHAEKRKIEKEYHRIVSETRELLLRPGEFFLNVPDLKEMPSQEELEDKEKGYGFAATSAFSPGRPLSDFALTEDVLKGIGITNPVFRSSLIESTTKNKPRVIAKVIDITGIIEEKKKKLKWGHSDVLKTKEVFEAMDAEGYRPATISELLAFAKDHWRPIPDPKKPFTEEEKEALLDSRYVYALGSATMLAGSYCVAMLEGSPHIRLLGGSWDSEWDSSCRFLFIRK